LSSTDHRPENPVFAALCVPERVIGLGGDVGQAAGLEAEVHSTGEVLVLETP